MKPATTAKLSTIAKMVARENPELFREMCAKSEPMLRNLALVPKIKAKIDEEYPDLDRTDQSILFSGICYFAYAPANMIDSSNERSPNGIRKEMCKAMGWKDAPTCNHYSRISMVYYKGKSFKEKIDHILSFFQEWSIKSKQTSLF